MAKVKGSPSQYREMAPAITPEAQESRCVAMAYSLVEQRLRDGSASSQETTHFLKLGSEKEKLERDKLREENKLLQAKTEALKSQKNIEELYTKAIGALTNYSGQGDEDEY